MALTLRCGSSQRQAISCNYQLLRPLTLVPLKNDDDVDAGCELVAIAGATGASRVAGRLCATRPETDLGASKRKQSRQGRDHSGCPGRMTATSTSTYAVSPWIASSRPSSSCASSTRTIVMRSMIHSIPNVKAKAQTDENSPAQSCFRKKLESPASNPFTPPLAAGFHAVEAKTPSRTIPRKPPTPCTPHTSRASSQPQPVLQRARRRSRPRPPRCR